MKPTSSFDYTTEDLDDMAVAHNYNDWLSSLMQSFLGKEILEVGSGQGTFAQVLQKKSSGSVTALEPSPTQFLMLNERLKDIKEIRVVKGFLSDLPAHETYSSIVYNNVMEHIEDNVTEMCEAYKHLRPGGYLIVYSPALPRLMSDFDRKIGHFHRYTRSDLTQKLKDADFDISLVKYVDFLGSFLWYIKFVLLKSQTLGSNNVALFDRLIVPIQSRIEAVVQLPFGKNILAVGQKPH